MVHYCAVPNCSETSAVKKPNLSFHSFPVSPFRRDLWVQTINRDNFIPTKHSKICSKHFRKSSFTGKRRQCLRQDACPTLFDFPNVKSIINQIRMKIAIQAMKGTEHISSQQLETSSRSDQSSDNELLHFGKNLDLENKSSSANSTSPLLLKELKLDIPNFRKIHFTGSSMNLTPETMTEQKCRVSQKKNKRYFWPKNVDNRIFATSRKETRNWRVALQIIRKQKRKITYLHQRTRRLEKQLINITNEMKKMREHDS